MEQDQTKQYWEKRLAGSGGLSGVGYYGLGKRYNHWIYAARRHRFHAEIEKLSLPVSTSCLDVGAGTGFYLTELSKLGFKNLTGSDFTDTACAGLKEKFANCNILQLDITKPGTLPPKTFDLVTCMDMLFHIVDNEGYEKAVSNLSSLLKSNGILIITENFTPASRDRGHICDRNREYIAGIFSSSGLKLVAVSPLFIFLNSPVQSAKKWHWRISNFRVSLLKKIENSKLKWLNSCLGFTIFTIDRLLLRFGVRDTGTSLVVFKKE